MLKFGRFDTVIKIQKNTGSGTNSNGFGNENWVDIFDEYIFCEWRNKYGVESWQAATIKAREPASIRLWYIQGVTPDCRVIRIDDESKPLEENPIFDIVNVDDVQNRHQQLEIELQRRVNG